MPISFGRKKAEEPEGPVEPARPRDYEPNAALLKDITHASEHHLTGCLTVTERTHGGRARLFFFDGGLYSVVIDGYVPDVTRRLVASGALDEGRAEYLASVASPGVEAVEQGWVTVDALATVHQEILLASLGAVLSCEKV
ncbi:MAG: hypothetical protein ACKO04_17065, partial [Actinomycetes bacterium]